jgi:hypothetical protein
VAGELENEPHTVVSETVQTSETHQARRILVDGVERSVIHSTTGEFVAVVAWDESTDSAAMRQHYRPAIERKACQLPAGGIDDDEPLEEAARRGMLAAGYTAAELVPVASIMPEARGVRRGHAYFPRPDPRAERIAAYRARRSPPLSGCVLPTLTCSTACSAAKSTRPSRCRRFGASSCPRRPTRRARRRPAAVALSALRRWWYAGAGIARCGNGFGWHGGRDAT